MEGKKKKKQNNRIMDWKQLQCIYITAGKNKWVDFPLSRGMKVDDASSLLHSFSEKKDECYGAYGRCQAGLVANTKEGVASV